MFYAELGTMNQKQVAALAGLAPYANDSGQYRGSAVIVCLWLPCLKVKLQDFYQRLTQKGKKPMISLTAVMRKLIVIANAKLKQLETNKNTPNLARYNMVDDE